MCATRNSPYEYNDDTREYYSLNPWPSDSFPAASQSARGGAASQTHTLKAWLGSTPSVAGNYQVQGAEEM